MTSIDELAPAAAASFSVERVVGAKGDRTVAVVLPARNEAHTVGAIVETIRTELMDRPTAGLGAAVVDDLVVMNDRSTDRTAEVANAAGARVVDTAALATDIAPEPGKGEAMWKSLIATDADIVCWCDADVLDFDRSYVLGLVGALCESDDAVMAKGHYQRPVSSPPGDDIGGRVTELVARPLISLLHPDLVRFAQPLSGEIAVKRAALDGLPMCRGYAVDLGLLIDLAATYGADRIRAVDLGVRRHRQQDLMSLGAMSTAITAMTLRRAGLSLPSSVNLNQPTGKRTVATPDTDLPPVRAALER